MRHSLVLLLLLLSGCLVDVLSLHAGAMHRRSLESPRCTITQLAKKKKGGGKGEKSEDDKDAAKPVGGCTCVFYLNPKRGCAKGTQCLKHGTQSDRLAAAAGL